MNNVVKCIIVAISAIMVCLLIVDLVIPTFGFFAKVDSGYVGIVTYFGKIEDKVLPAGFHITRYFEHVHPINVRTQIKTSDVIAFSSDIQQVSLTVSINYNVTPESANTLYKTISGDYYSTLISPRINENVKVVVSNYTAEKLIANREILSSEVLKLMQTDLASYGITATSISIENIDFTDAFESAVEAKQVATQEKQRAQTQQEQQTMEAEQAAKRKTIAAQADAEVAQIQADADAYAVRVKAEAEADANTKINASLTPELIDYTKIYQWNGELPTFVGSGTIPIINMETENTAEQE